VQVDNVLTVTSNTLVDGQRPFVSDEPTKGPLADGVFGRSKGPGRECLRSGWEQSIFVSLWCGWIGSSRNLLAEKGLMREHRGVFWCGTLLCGGGSGWNE
jgi:hypothetical protein